MALMDEKFLDAGDGTYFYVDRDQDTPTGALQEHL